MSIQWLLRGLYSNLFTGSWDVLLTYNEMNTCTQLHYCLPVMMVDENNKSNKVSGSCPVKQMSGSVFFIYTLIKVLFFLVNNKELLRTPSGSSLWRSCQHPSGPYEQNFLYWTSIFLNKNSTSKCDITQPWLQRFLTRAREAVAKNSEHTFTTRSRLLSETHILPSSLNPGALISASFSQKPLHVFSLSSNWPAGRAAGLQQSAAAAVNKKQSELVD